MGPTATGQGPLPAVVFAAAARRRGSDVGGQWAGRDRLALAGAEMQPNHPLINNYGCVFTTAIATDSETARRGR